MSNEPNNVSDEETGTAEAKKIMDAMSVFMGAK